METKETNKKPNSNHNNVNTIALTTELREELHGTCFQWLMAFASHLKKNIAAR